MQIPKGSGLEMLDNVVRRSLNYYSGILKTDRFRQNILSSMNRKLLIQPPSLDSLKRPVESLMKGLNKAISQFAEKPVRVDYNAVVYSFLPPGSKLIKPQYPENSNEIQFDDLDGDGRNELIASYKTNEGINTLILGKDALQWYKIADISNPEYEDIHYRNSADMSGDGKKYLLLGLTSKLKTRTILAYSLDGVSAKKIFSRRYSKLELQKPRSTAGARTKAALALWNEEAPEIYDIELVNWNGFEIQQLDNTQYLAGKVVPYYIRRLRQNPDNAADWYNLASAMSKTGNTSNASRAIELGLERNPDTMLRDKFNSLKSRL